jgi:hypothetical protein
VALQATNRKKRTADFINTVLNNEQGGRLPVFPMIWLKLEVDDWLYHWKHRLLIYRAPAPSKSPIPPLPGTKLPDCEETIQYNIPSLSPKMTRFTGKCIKIKF